MWAAFFARTPRPFAPPKGIRMDLDQKGIDQIKVDTANLYKEEVFSDMRTGTLRRMTPIKIDGTPDLSRPGFFLGQTHVMSNAGPVPVEFKLEVATLQEACDRFPAAVQQAIEEMLAEIQAMQRERASSLILPGSGSGKIQMP